jgi:hypothetical protein
LFPNHVLPHHPDLPMGRAAQTVLVAVRSEVSSRPRAIRATHHQHPKAQTGVVVLTVAQSAADPRLSAHVELAGNVCIVDHARTMHTPATTSDI